MIYHKIDSHPTLSSLNFSSITYKSCPHLDGKHTIFGRLVAGSDTLDRMEKIEVNNEDQPIEAIRIEDVHILVNPFQAEVEMPSKERIDEIETLQLDRIGESKRKQSTRSLKSLHEVFNSWLYYR